MAALVILGGDFARDKESSYWMGSFRVRPRGGKDHVVLSLDEADSLTIGPPDDLPVALFGAAGAVTGASIGDAVAGPLAAAVGALVGAANETHDTTLANRMKRQSKVKRCFDVRFKDGRRLRAAIVDELSVFDRMQALFDAGRTKSNETEQSRS